jgi:hypothetical protein
MVEGGKAIQELIAQEDPRKIIYPKGYSMIQNVGLTRKWGLSKQG